jgi:lactate dehydrogenase-like 2-hydroxyacid dehydrogenase
VCTSTDTILSQATIKKLLGSRCDGVIGQLTEQWDKELFGALRSAGGSAYSNYAVGYDNVVVADATAAGVAVGNTPGARAARGREGDAAARGWRHPGGEARGYARVLAAQR